LLACGYLYYNLIVTGFLTGKARIAPPENAVQLIKMVVLAFARELVPVLPIAFKSIKLSALFWFIGLPISAGVIYSVVRKWRDSGASGNKTPFDLDVRLLVWSGLVYWIAVVSMRMTAYFDPLGFRQMWPGTLLILIGLCLWIGRYGLCPIVARNGLIALVLMGVVGTATNMAFYNKRSYLAQVGPIIERYKKVPSNSVAVFAPGYILYLRPDIQITIPQAYPVCPKSETWDNYLGRMKSIPAGGVWIDYDEAKSYLSDKTFKFDESVKVRFEKTTSGGVLRIPDMLPSK
jgi:hypothetical protein